MSLLSNLQSSQCYKLLYKTATGVDQKSNMVIQSSFMCNKFLLLSENHKRETFQKLESKFNLNFCFFLKIQNWSHH